MDITYKEFINNILKTRGRFACGKEYYERHHIIPRCIGGTNDKENLIDLFGREHFEAHRMLALENPENEKLVYAWWCMSVQTNQHTRERYEITPEEYEEVRKHYVITLSENMKGEGNHFYGKKHSEETKQKISENHADTKGINAKSILQYDINGNFIKEWSCITTAANELNIDRHMISRCLTNKQTTTQWKYMWFYKNGFSYDKVLYNIKKLNEIKENRKKMSLNNNTSKRPVYCVEIQKAYYSMTDASKDTGVQRAKIDLVCNEKRKTAGSYHWKYLYDQTRKDGTVIQGAITLGLITEEEALKILEEQKDKTEE